MNDFSLPNPRYGRDYMKKQIKNIFILLIFLQLSTLTLSQPVARAPTTQCSVAFDYADKRSGNTFVVCTQCNTGYILQTWVQLLGQDNVDRLTSKCNIDCPIYYGVTCAICVTSFCTLCIPGYAIDRRVSPQTCVDCLTLSNCLACSNGFACTQCQERNGVDQSNFSLSCAPCSESCDLCTHGPRCQTCKMDLFLDFEIGNTSCVPCQFPNCANCQDGPKCASCNELFYLDFDTMNKSCISCQFPNCANCTDGPFCISCNNNFYLDFSSNNKSCVSCFAVSPVCLSCSDGPICTSCPVNYILSSFTQWNNCIKCKPLEYSSAAINQCLPCPIHCLACYQQKQRAFCERCQIGYSPDRKNKECMKCDTNMPQCLECTTLTVCSLCNYPFLVGNTSVCDICENDYEYVLGYCSKPIGCQSSLPDFSKCTVCYSEFHFFYDKINDQCKCVAGYYITNSSGFTTCTSKCGDGILVASDEQCDDGNFRNNDGCSSDCIRENDFSCTAESPSKCTLHYSPQKFFYNYVFKFEGQNKCKFSLVIQPPSPNLKNVDWLQYLTFNISDDMIMKSSKTFTYLEETSELIIEMEYLKSLENLTIEFKFLKNKSPGRLLEYSSENEIKYPKFQHEPISTNKQESQAITESVGMSGNSLPSLVISMDFSLIVNLKGVNAKIIYEEDSILTAYKSVYTTSLIITVIILLQFVIGSYFHKMIGLETLHIIQFFYFARVIIEQSTSDFLNSMNAFKYAAYGGFTDYETFYGSEIQQAESLTFMTVADNFVAVGLMKYFSLNVNLSLIVPALVILGFLLTLSRKYIKRNQYLKTLNQAQKDQYTVLRRSCLWLYDHFVFPYLNIFSMVVFFSTILYLQSLSSAQSVQLEKSQLNRFIQETSFSPHLFIVFITFLIFCSEVFGSYEEFQHSRRSQKEKARVPKSMIEKLEHDENNPDRPNYKPGYVLSYLIFYLIVEVSLMVSILLPSLKDFGLEIMACVSFTYLLFIWIWKPYNKAVDFHNKALRLNHSTVFLFILGSLVAKRVHVEVKSYVVFIYIILFMVAAVAVCGYLRIIIEYRFRKKLLEKPTLMEEDSQSKKGQLSIDLDTQAGKQRIFVQNPYVFQNQLKEKFRQQGILINRKMTENELNQAKAKVRMEIYRDKKRIHSIMKANYFPLKSIISNELNNYEQIQKKIQKPLNKNQVQIRKEQSHLPLVKNEKKFMKV